MLALGLGWFLFKREIVNNRWKQVRPCLRFAIVLALHLTAFPDSVIPEVRNDVMRAVALELCSPDGQHQRDLEPFWRCTFQAPDQTY